MGLFDKDIIGIFSRYLTGRASDQEKTLVEEYYSFFDRHQTQLPAAERSALESQIWAGIHRQTTRPAAKLTWLRYAAAACVILTVAILVLHNHNHNLNRLDTHPARQLARQTHPIVPGSAHATLVLADGTKRELTTGLLQYSPAAPKTPAAQNRNTLITPRGGTYQVVLADGTHIWLDAASSLTYNTDNDPGTIQLTGRAYFEVAPHPGQPFEVGYKNQLLVVLGTHFTIDSYEAPHTTLLQGKIRLSAPKTKTIVLTPGEQATLGQTQFLVSQVDTSAAIAWKNNVFSFKNADIRDVLKEASRWYDFDVVYDTDIPERRIDGSPSRNLPFDAFLRIISLTGLHFSITGDTLHVAR